jgi:site-specific recombinase XerD
VLNLYRRHQAPCRYRSRRYRVCHCPIWVQGSLRGEHIRRALDLRSWSAATDLVRDWEATGEIGVVKKPDIPAIAEAAERFLSDARAQQLSRETIRKHENLLKRRLVPWCETKGFRYLKQLSVEQIRQFRATWADSANYATKNLERLRAFFRFCMEDDWITKNPARRVKAPKVKPTPTLPFSDAEMRRILGACDSYPGNRDRIRAFVLVMRHSGLRIGDTIALDETRLVGHTLFLYTAKTGTPVYVPVPPVVVDALSKLPTNERARYFSSGNAKPQTDRADWSRYLGTVFELANVQNAHSHRFRDTFAVSLLLKGVSLENVSRLLGHSSIRVTERHYAPWVKARQTMLEAEVRRTWDGTEASVGDRTAVEHRPSDQAIAHPSGNRARHDESTATVVPIAAFVERRKQKMRQGSPARDSGSWHNSSSSGPVIDGVRQ